MIVLWALVLAPEHVSIGQSENEKDQKKNKNNSKRPNTCPQAIER
jgi:hypothetical protein